MWRCINLGHSLSQIELFSLSQSFIHLAVGMQTGCSEPFHLHQPTLVSKVELMYLFDLVHPIGIWRCINYKCNASLIEMFSLSHGFIHLAVGMGTSCPGMSNLHSPTWVSKVKLMYLFYLVHPIWMWNVSIIITILANLSCFLCRMVSYACLHREGVQTVQGSLTSPNLNFKCSFHFFQSIWMWRCIYYNHNSSQAELELGVGGGGCHMVTYAWQHRWGLAVQGGLACPHPPGY